jgi:two-component system, NarL family, response regulator DevR
MDAVGVADPGTGLPAPIGSISVGLVAGHPVIMGVLRLACAARDIVVAGEWIDADSARGSAGLVAPDVLIVDLELPDSDGLDLIRDLVDGGFPAAILAVSERDDGPTVLEALRRGAAGYLTKPDGLRRVASAIRSLAVGERVLDPGVEAAALAELGRFARQAREGSEVHASLSPREREILGLLADGLTTRQIGRRLEISPRTVESHVAKVYRKLGASSRVQAVSRAAQLGLIELR